VMVMVMMMMMIVIVMVMVVVVMVVMVTRGRYEVAALCREGLHLCRWGGVVLQ
jgi:hypothetical protein